MLRVADVWLDEYKTIFNSHMSKAHLKVSRKIRFISFDPLWKVLVHLVMVDLDITRVRTMYEAFV